LNLESEILNPSGAGQVPPVGGQVLESVRSRTSSAGRRTGFLTFILFILNQSLAVQTHFVLFQILAVLSRRLFVTTDTELRAMAIPANIGSRVIP